MSNLGTRAVDLHADMAAYDALPPAMRQALANAGGEYAALDFVPVVKRGGVPSAFKLLRQAERRHGFGDVPELSRVIEKYRPTYDTRRR